jgi:hypothetical protein
MGNLPTRDARMLLARFNEAHLSFLTTDTRQLFKVVQFAASPCTSGGRDRQPFAVVRLAERREMPLPLKELTMSTFSRRYRPSLFNSPACNQAKIHNRAKQEITEAGRFTGVLNLVKSDCYRIPRLITVTHVQGTQVHTKFHAHLASYLPWQK